MIHLNCVIVVEGRYDRARLAALVDAPILQTDGFGIFRDRDKLLLLRRLAETREVLILTDADLAGGRIRSFLKSALPGAVIRHAYIPRIPGKERRKAVPGREGVLGVEGMSTEVLLEALGRAAVDFDQRPAAPGVTRMDFYRDGLSGAPDSRRRRQALARGLKLPEDISAAALLDAVNWLGGREAYDRLVHPTEKEAPAP